MVAPITHSEVFETTLEAAAAIDAIVSRFTSDGLSVERDAPTHAQGKGGSRLSMRLWGVLGPSGGARVPFTFRVQASPDNDGARVSLELKSNEGWYLFRVESLIEPAYQSRFESLVASALEATSSSG
ncbi:hypothetical protein FHX74_001642 [Friedmanniella endophytica]|uniref:Polyketide cyclase / dehydrase and lipid transport n=1 Tax=Microlunatus kandeliicorticis TaxID=1759536 RepID=A0A7W3P5N2_9ACTN|nr:hypothetical protein [Microlunatus kandeliicorticis]